MSIEIPFQLERGLIYIHVSIPHAGKALDMSRCIFDTGSAGTTFDADKMAGIGLTLSPDSKIRRLTTAGGYQRVFTRDIEELHLGKKVLSDIEIEIGDTTQARYRTAGGSVQRRAVRLEAAWLFCQTTR